MGKSQELKQDVDLSITEEDIQFVDSVCKLARIQAVNAAPDNKQLLIGLINGEQELLNKLNNLLPKK